MTTVYKAKKAAVKLLAQDQPESGQSPEELKFAINYLSFFGYVGIALLKNLTVEDLKTATRVFQRWFGLKPDGIVGPKTVRAMAEPRCGCPDILDEDKKEHAEYLQMQELIEESRIRWSKTRLTYAIDGYVSGLSKKMQADMLAAAFRGWTDLIDLEIHRCSITKIKDADILVGVGSGTTHKFDGRGGTLAWAYLPQRDKQLRMRFDLAETWVTSPTERGIHYQAVASHEIGHLLGLKHSKAKGALMAPYYNPFIGNPQAKDDIARIQKLYGVAPARKALTANTRTVFMAAGQDLLIKCKT